LQCFFMNRRQGIIIGIFGLIFGSFGSVILTRLWDIPSRKELKGFLFGHSKCPHCHHPLQSKDLIPLLSFLLQRGKCRYCHQKISFIYPLLELLTAGLFLWTFCVFGFENLFFSCSIAGILRLSLIVALYDILKLELHLIGTILIFLIGIGLARHEKVLWTFFLRTGIFFVFFLGIYYFAQWFSYFKYHEKKEGFWFGDVIFSASIGGLFPLILNLSDILQGIYGLLSYLICCCLLGIFYYTFSSIGKKKKKSDASILPFLPSMIGTLWIFVFMGEKILSYFW